MLKNSTKLMQTIHSYTNNTTNKSNILYVKVANSYINHIKRYA